ncbi:MAG: twin-arginine translocase TatA/TatE family subunit [Thermomicrobia bacterium]|nr:twin-arginine translocase TatA/TatE family subunit [Thermomicrobia bacterium]MCA1724727.1 twin-arginine translocase TatA/TatE family subunit [Thermomicrobia bacterium]
MEFFGIGAPELMVILVIAIVMFGPDKIPSMAAQVGKTIRDFRRYTSELTKEFDAATGDLRQEFQNIAGDLRGELEATQADLRSQLDLTDVFKMDTPAETVPAMTGSIGESALAALGTETATAVAEPPQSQPETIIVTTPYADALAAPATVGAPTVAAVATKANPFADLLTLAVGTAATTAAAAPLPDSTETITAVTNGHRKVIGGSVCGSKYRRRKSA